MNETVMTVCGNLVADPEARSTKNLGRRFVTFRIASTPRRLVNGQYADGPTSFLNVVAFGRLGANALHSVKKGDSVIVQGRLRVSQWSSGERSGTSVEVDAYTIGHDLNRGTTSLSRVAATWPGDDRLDDPAVRGAILEEMGEAPTDDEPDSQPDGEGARPIDVTGLPVVTGEPDDHDGDDGNDGDDTHDNPVPELHAPVPDGFLRRVG
jgi:single-strand DNA-binding protein